MFQPRVFLHLLRSLFPRWNFFDRVSYDLSFEVKARAVDNWQRVSFTVTRPAFGLFINAEANLALAQQSLVQQFVQDLLDQSETIEDQASYKMVVDLAQRQAGANEFQFKVSARHDGKTIAMYASTWLTGEASP